MNNQSRETSLSNDPNLWGVGIVFEELEINFPTNICEDGFRRNYFLKRCVNTIRKGDRKIGGDDRFLPRCSNHSPLVSRCTAGFISSKIHR